MRKKVTKFCVLTLFCISTIMSCHKDGADFVDDECAEINKAQNWYNNMLSSSTMLKSTDFVKGKMKAKPNWANAFYNDLIDSKVVEVPIISQGLFGFSTPENQGSFEESGDNRFRLSQTTLVILTSKKEDYTYGFLMTLIPQRDFLLKTNFDSFRSTYKKWQPGFSGYVLYHDIDGTFRNGWGLFDGQVINSVNSQESDMLEIELVGTANSTKDEQCHDYALVAWYQDCMDWYTNGVYTNTTCGTPYSEIVYTFTVCISTGGSGGTPPPSGLAPKPYTPQPNDKFSKPALLNTMPRQLPNTCVTSIMEYVNNEYCGGNTNEGVYITDYLRTFGELVTTDGVDLENIESFVNRHFYTPVFKGFKDAVDRHRVVMTNVKSNISGSFHNVLVIGYHPDGSLIYMDPELGVLQEAPKSEFGSLYSISISSCL